LKNFNNNNYGIRLDQDGPSIYAVTSIDVISGRKALTSYAVIAFQKN